MKNLIYNDIPDTARFDDGLEEFRPVESRPVWRVLFGIVFLGGTLATGGLIAALFTAWV